MECVHVAMTYGAGHNRYDLYEYDHDTHVLTLSLMAIRPDEEFINTAARYSLETGVFECFYWGDVRSIKQVVSGFLVNILAVFDVREIRGPDGFLEKWHPRMEKRREMREVEQIARRM